jgi:hypothetical protein
MFVVSAIADKHVVGANSSDALGRETFDIRHDTARH